MDSPPRMAPGWVILVGQQLYQSFQILRCNPLNRLAQPVEAIDGQAFRRNAADDLAGQGAVYYPKVGAVPDAGAAQETFQPFRLSGRTSSVLCPSP